MQNLQFLMLDGCNLSGSIPASLDNLSNLKELSLSFNNYSGALPTSLTDITTLEKLNLSYNEFTGNIPLEFSSMLSIQEIDLRGNNLSGCIPIELQSLCGLNVQIRQNPLLLHSNFYDFCSDGIGTCGESIALELSVNLEGAYDESSGLMRDHLINFDDFAMFTPFKSFDIIDDYDNFNPQFNNFETTTEDILSNTGDNAIVDWVFIELRDGNNPSTVIQTKSAFLQRDGSIVNSYDGTFRLEFHNPSPGYPSVIVAVRHRNHLGVRTTIPHVLSGVFEVLTYDFRDPNLEVFGGSNALATIGNVKAMIAGDANRDGQINSFDKNAIWRNENGGFYQYYITNADFNLDGIVNSIDKNIYWRVNNGKVQFLD